MFSEEIEKIGNIAKAKIDFLENSSKKYFLASILAGIYIGFGVIFTYTIAGLLNEFSGTKIITGATFSVALSLVVMAGAELFTGNNMIMAIGAFTKKITWNKTIKLWLICYLGNWFGATLIALIFIWSGLNTDAVEKIIINTSLLKATLAPIPLLIRGILCNILVCLAVWCIVRCKSESGKLIMIFWCIFAFVTSGFEHSIANMVLFSISFFSSDNLASIFNYLYNLGLVTLGNMIGGVFAVALPYYLLSKKN